MTVAIAEADVTGVPAELVKYVASRRAAVKEPKTDYGADAVAPDVSPSHRPQDYPGTVFGVGARR